MALVMKNILATAGTSLSDVYTCPANTSATLTFINVSAKSATNATVSLKISDASNSNAEEFILYNVNVTAGAPLAFPQGLVLEAGDKLRIVASVGAAVSVTGSVMERPA